MVSLIPSSPMYSPPSSPVFNDSSSDEENLSLEELSEKFFSANENERKEILIDWLRNYALGKHNSKEDPSEFEDSSIFQGLLNTLMQNTLYDCGMPLLQLPLLSYPTLEECQTDNRWIEKIDIDSLENNLLNASPRSLNLLAELFDHRFLHIIENENAEEEDVQVQHWELYCRAGVVIANHALTHHRGNVDPDEFGPMIIKLALCAGKGNEREQLQFSGLKIFQNILEELLTVVTSEACRDLDSEVELRVREALVNATMLPNPRAQEHFSYLIPLLQKQPTSKTCDEELAKTIFLYSSDLEISMKAAQLFCFDPKAIDLINRIGQLYQTCLQNRAAVDQKILLIAAFMSTHTKSMEAIPWPATHAWWDEMESHVSEGQKNCLKILRQILVGKGEEGQPKLIREAAQLCLVTFFSRKDWGNSELLDVLHQLEDETDSNEYPFVQALGPLFFQEAANIIYSDEESGKNYGDALRCICLAGGLKGSREAFSFIYRLFLLAEQQAFGELYFAMFQALDKGNMLLPKDPVKASQYLDKSREHRYKPASATLLASPTAHRVTPRHVQSMDDVFNPEESPTQLFCKEMKKMLALLSNRDENGYDLSRFPEIVEEMTRLFLHQDSELDRQYVLDTMKITRISSIIARISDIAFSKDNSPEMWNCQLLLGLVNWHLRPDIHEEGLGIDFLRIVAKKAPDSTSLLAKNRARLFLKKYCNANFERAKELFNVKTDKEAFAALSYAFAACYGGCKGDQKAIKKAFKAKAIVAKILAPKTEDEKKQFIDAHMTLTEVYLTESFGISRDVRKIVNHVEKIKRYAPPEIGERYFQGLRSMLDTHMPVRRSLLPALSAAADAADMEDDESSYRVYHESLGYGWAFGNKGNEGTAFVKFDKADNGMKIDKRFLKVISKVEESP